MNPKTAVVVVLNLITTIVLHSQITEGFDNAVYPPLGWTVYSSGGTTVWNRLTNNTRNASAGTANSTNPSAGVIKHLTVSLNASSGVTTVSYYIAVSSVATGTGATLVVQAGTDTTSMTILRTINLEDAGIFTANTYVLFTDNIDGSLASGQTGAVDLRTHNPAFIRWSHQKVSGFSASCRLEDVSIPNATALPVELVSFSALPVDRGVMLHWQTATETNNHGFEIERMKLNQSVNGSKMQWTKISFVNGKGTTNAPNIYSFFDHVSLSGSYAYRLKQLDRDGAFSYSPELEVTVKSVPAQFSLEQNYPNPFNPSTIIRYQLPTDGHVSLTVFDPIGRTVAMLVNEVKSAGIYAVEFDASALPNGMYIARLACGGKQSMRKMLLVK